MEVARDHMKISPKIGTFAPYEGPLFYVWGLLVYSMAVGKNCICCSGASFNLDIAIVHFLWISK
jgi:hypothetical protein